MIRPPDPLLGIIYKVLAVGCFSVMNVIIKGVGQDIHTGQVVFFRGLFAFVPLAFMIHAAGGLGTLRTHHPLKHLIRSGVGTMAMLLGFTALVLIPLVDAVAITFAATLFTTVMAALVLKESVGIYRWSAVTVGFFGVLMMLEPSGLRLLDPGSLVGEADETYAIGAVVALCGAFCMAVAMISIRSMSGTETSASIIFYFTLTNTLVAACTLPFVWIWPTTLQWVMLIGIGVCGGVAQICLTLGYRYAQASLLAPFDYSAMVYALVLGYLFFGEVPQTMVLGGAAVVIGAGLFIIWREQVRRARRAPNLGGMPG
ncbi:MAG: DMT family transporter [Rhodospirillaceae bacterium]|nr:DMT family transporter [Rhodospirillaceae bacterium]